MKKSRYLIMLLSGIIIVFIICMFPQVVRADVEIMVYGNQNGYIDDYEMEYNFYPLRFVGEFTENEVAYVLMRNVFDDDVFIYSVEIIEDTIIIDISKNFLNYGGSSYELSFIDRLFQNLLNFPRVEKVTLLIEGKKSYLTEGSFLYKTKIYAYE